MAFRLPMCSRLRWSRPWPSSPVIFAMANPDPEIKYELAKEARPDSIVATGRSDYPNQVNNVLGFPFIFRGALDVRARAINEEMKFAASQALAALAKEDVPDSVLRAYGVESMKFGMDYIIPKPLDPRVLLYEAPAVARTAMETGVARKNIDIDEYREQLAYRLGKGEQMRYFIMNKARARPRRQARSSLARARSQRSSAPRPRWRRKASPRRC